MLTRAAIAITLLVATGCEDGGAPATTGQAVTRAEVTASTVTESGQAAASDSGSDASPADGAASNTAPAGDPVPNSEATPAVSEVSTASRAQPDRTRDITFDDLKFDIQKGDPFERSLLTEKIEALEGKPIRIRGYILPSFQQSGLTQFVLVRDNQSCCFGPGAALYDCVIVEMKPGKSTDYSLYPVAVDGTFSIRELVDPDGKTVAVYHLDGESVR